MNVSPVTPEGHEVGLEPLAAAHRDSACYSVIEPEWPAVRASLEARRRRYGAGGGG